MPREKLLLKILNKHYAPSCVIDTKYKGLDMTFKTDKEGNPIIMFIGKRQENGMISGGRFTRTLVKDKNGRILKDHWDLKGKAS